MSGVSHDLLTFTFGGQEILFWLPDKEDDFVQAVMWKNSGFWERRLLERVRTYVGRDSVVIDAGGFVGNHAIYFSKICGARHVHSFEPQSHIADIMARNIELNGVGSTVSLYCTVLGDKPGRASAVSGLSGSRATTSFRYASDGQYEVRTIDSYNLQRVDFMKVDVEGSEVSVLRGARQTLVRFSPVVWVEAVTSDEYLSVSMCMEELGYVNLEQISEMDYLFAKGKV